MSPDTIAMARQVAKELCEIQSEPNPPTSLSPSSLVFPSYRSSTALEQPARISEAEARVLYCMALANRRLPFAVEVPTTQKYKFSGETEMSARTDLVVYDSPSGASAELVRALAIEFKAHNPQVESIRKDLEKLLREPYDGLWFHLLQNVDSRTIPVLMAKFTQSIEYLHHFWQKCTHTLTICVVVREKRFWLERTLVPALNPALDLSIDYVVEGKEVVVRDPKAWNYQVL